LAIGHGSPDRWGKQDLFANENVPALIPTSSSAPPIVLQFTCLSGFFAHPEIVSISETLLRHPTGPVLVVGASSLTYSSSQEPFATALLTALQDPTISRMGDAMRQAKAGLDTQLDSLREIGDTFGLFGDPSTLIIRPNSP